MRFPAAAITIILLSGCDRVTEAYPTYTDARSAGAVSRGWVPAFVPTSARDISDSHDLDTSRQTLRFTVPVAQISAMVSGFERIDHQASLDSFASKRGLGSATQSWLVCAEPVSGVLSVARDSGRAVYDTTFVWADSACSKRS